MRAKARHGGAAWAWAAALVLAGCGEQQAPEARGALNIALIIPTTGDLASYGRQARQGAELAWAEINLARQQPPGEVKFWINIRDDHADTQAAVRTAEQLRPVADLLATIGPLAADSAVAVAGKMAPHGMTVLVPTVETEGLAKGHPNVVQACLTSAAIGRLLARFVGEQLRPARPQVLVLRVADDPEAKALAGGFEAGAQGLAPPLQVSVHELSTEDADLGPVVDRVRTERPGAVVACLGPEGFGLLVRALRAAGAGSIPVVGGTQAWARAALAPTSTSKPISMGEVYVAAHFAPDAEEALFPGTAKFVKNYTEMYKRAEPDATAALTYDAVKLVDQALRAAMPGRADERTKRPALPTPQAVGQTLRAGARLSDAEAAAGAVAVNPDGSVSRTLFILRLDETGARYFASVRP